MRWLGLLLLSLVACAAESPEAAPEECSSRVVAVSAALGPAWLEATRQAYAAWSAELPDAHIEVVSSHATPAGSCVWSIEPGERAHLAVTERRRVVVDETRGLRPDAMAVLLTHEAGHTLGLGDSDDVHAMMFARINDFHATRIADSDRAQLCRLHPC